MKGHKKDRQGNHPVNGKQAMITKTLFNGKGKQSPVLGITGTGGAGKSSVTDEIVRRFLSNFPTKLSPLSPLTLPRKKRAGLCWVTG